MFGDERDTLIEKLNKKLTTKANQKKLLSRESILKIPEAKQINDMDPDIFDQIYSHYENLYNTLEESIQENRPYKQRKIIETDDDDFAWKLDQFISKNHDELLSPEDFENITNDWQRGRKEHTMKQWYKLYKNKFYNQAGNSIQIDPSTLKYHAYKSKNKIDKLKKIGVDLEELQREDYETNTFPINDNKKFYLHSCKSPHTYFIDYMFEFDYCYLIAINANTRYLYVQPVNTIIQQDGRIHSAGTKNLKTSRFFQKALKKLITHAKWFDPKVLIGDEEPAFISSDTKQFLKSYGIKFIAVPRMRLNVSPDWKTKKQPTKTDPLHSSLGIVDRVIRTLRDMAYNAEIEKIDPVVMQDLVDMYNKAPHEGISRFAGNSISPEDAQSDPELEKFIIRRILQSNYNIQNQDGFDIGLDETVRVYNGKDPLTKRRSVIQPGEWVVQGFQDGTYIVVNPENQDTQYIPRYMLDPIE